MGSNNDGYAILGIGVAIFCFLLVLLGIGTFYGGNWTAVSQGVAKFILLIVGFAVGSFVVFMLIWGRN